LIHFYKRQPGNNKQMDEYANKIIPA